MTFIETSRLTLIPLSEAQLRQCLENYPEFEAALGLEISGEALSEATRQAAIIKLWRMTHNAAEAIWFTYWVLVNKARNRAIGMAGFKGPPNESHEVEIGYGLQPAYQNQGFMTEAVAGLLEWVFTQQPVIVIIAITEKDNLPSQRVLEKLGFLRVDETETNYTWKLRTDAG